MITQIGQIKKLNGHIVFVIDEVGHEVQVDHFSFHPYAPIVHPDRLSDVNDFDGTELVAKIRRRAVEFLGAPQIGRDLAQMALMLAHAYETREKRSDAVEGALRDEGSALDDVARERDGALRELDGACKELAQLRSEFQRSQWTATSLDNQLAKSDTKNIEQAKEIAQLRNDLVTMNKAHEQVLLDRDELARRNEKLSASTYGVISTLAKALEDANVEGFTTPFNPILVEVVAPAESAIREFGILNTELRAINDALQGVALPGESVSTAVKRIVGELRGVREELGKMLIDNKSWLQHSEMIQALRGDIERATSERDLARSEVNRLHAQLIRTTNDNVRREAIAEMEAIADLQVEMGADPAHVYSVEKFREAAHAQLAIPDAEVTRPDVPLSPLAKRVYDRLAAEREPIGSTSIKALLGIGSSDWAKAKGELLDRKLIVQFGEKKGAKYACANGV